MNGRRPGFFEFVSRLPPRIWLQAALGLIGFAILAVLGFAVIAGGVAIAVVILLIYRLRAWLAALFTGRSVSQPPARTDDRNVTDVPYEIVDRRDDKS
ncbi:MAG: hypothetical protein J0J01_28425 [Reyranella sp.]|uniref:hypothetical protein n=1 Tax=Reyranella sp. TaxID=1929291 RepID=UPI001AC229FA|nr:hypothetical protein [Reyranella sp.]MBN9090859.1 hypothetical protein [Reyranella sp.]